jgi:dTDP-4-dehydrorhamnose reductase
VVNDKDGTPTYTHDFARNVKALVGTEFWGLYNMVCGGQTSRFEVAGELLKQLGLDGKIKLNAVESSHFAKEYFAPRPDCERLVNSKLDLRGLNQMQDWRVALAQYLRDYYAGYLG